MSSTMISMSRPMHRTREDGSAIARKIRQNATTYRRQYERETDARCSLRGEVVYPLVVGVTLKSTDVILWQSDRGNPHPVECAARCAPTPAHDIYLADPTHQRGLLLCRGWDRETRTWRMEACYSAPLLAMLEPRAGMTFQLIRVPLPKDEELDPYGFVRTGVQ